MTGENIVKEYRFGTATVFLIFMQRLSESDVGEMYELCDRERREKVDKITSVTKRKQSICAGFLFYLFQKRLHITETPVILSGGKPVFVKNRDIHFNISHSGDYVAFAFGDSPLGVDIECVKRTDLKVAKRFFTEEEYTYLAGRKEVERADLFCQMWTGKEAVVKASGEGLSVPLDSFSVLGETVECRGIRYGLSQQKIEEHGQALWISVAQVV